MTENSWPIGSIPHRWNNLDNEERAIVGNKLIWAIHEGGSATAKDFEAGIDAVNYEASKFYARLHGGPGDGVEMRYPMECADQLNYVQLLSDDITQDDIDDAIMGVRTFPVQNHTYRRRQGTPAPQPGGAADFDHVGLTPGLN
jgi:hypothetical protein